MKLDRDTNERGVGKYALIKMRVIEAARINDPTSKDHGKLPPNIAAALTLLTNIGAIDNGFVNSPGEFFVIKLRDIHADNALRAYAYSARTGVWHTPEGGEPVPLCPPDLEYADAVLQLSERAGLKSKFVKAPD